MLIAEDAYIAREGTRRLLEDQPGVEVVGAAADHDEVLSAARELAPDVVKAGAPAWLGAAVAVSAIGQGIGLATSIRALAVAAFAALFLSLAGVVRVLTRSGSSPLPRPAMSTT